MTTNAVDVNWAIIIIKKLGPPSIKVAYNATYSSTSALP